jgi:peptidoglycan L-alanyl-D-glutamate endopeptidase CwlK
VTSATSPETVDRDLTHCAPSFVLNLVRGLQAARAAGLDPIVHEAYRSDARQRWLFAQGRARPGEIVTHAQSALYSWHGYGLAADVISASRGWDDPSFFRRLAPHMQRAGLDWGGDWSTPDLPHFQWFRCKASPSDRARDLFAAGGLAAVWREVVAI